jgi:hypothetical protein
MIRIDRKKLTRPQHVEWFFEDTKLPPKEEFEIVVVRRDEEFRWADRVAENITLAERDEHHAFYHYMQFIAERYDTLAPRTLFLRGDPFEFEMPKLAWFLLDHDFITCYDSWWTIDNLYFGNMVRAVSEQIGEQAPKVALFNYGAQFMATRDLIRSRPRSFYQEMADFCGRKPCVIGRFAVSEHRSFQILEMLCAYIFRTDPLANMWWQEYFPLRYSGP